MKFNTVNTQKIKYSKYQNAYLTFHAYHYQRATSYLTKWLVYLGKDYKNSLDNHYSKVRYNIQRRIDIDIPLRVFWFHFNKLPSNIAQNIIIESFQNAKSMLLKPQKDYHHNFTFKSFTISNGGFKIINNKLSLSKSKEVNKFFLNKVDFNLNKKVLNHVQNTCKKFYIRFRYSQGKWFIDFMKQFNTNYQKVTDSELKFAAIDIGLDNFCLIDQETLKPILFDLDELFYKALKLFKKYSLAQKENNPLKVKKYKSKITNFFKSQLKLYAIRIINYLKRIGINRLSIGNASPEMKKGTLNRQIRKLWNMIPFSYFINYLKFQGSKNSIYVYKIGEHYTSKCSSIDLEEIKKHEQYKGKRITRGLYKTNNKIVIHADANGALNILRRTIYSRIKDLDFIREFENKILKSIRAVSNCIRVSFKQLNRSEIKHLILLIKSKDYGKTCFLRIKNLIIGFKFYETFSQSGKEKLLAGLHPNIKSEFMRLY